MVRLFQNLIGNAVKYRKANQPSKVHITAEQKGAEWVISIRDNGIGFDPAFASVIFTPFKRLHSAGENMPERGWAWPSADASCRLKAAASGRSQPQV